MLARLRMLKDSITQVLELESVKQSVKSQACVWAVSAQPSKKPISMEVLVLNVVHKVIKELWRITTPTE